MSFVNIQLMHTRDPLFEETHYYPFGLSMKVIGKEGTGVLQNKYKYNGKEEQRKEFSDGSGLELYDYGARNFNSQIGRWQTIDPLSDSSRGWSPFLYGENNPIRNVDVDGMYSDFYDEAGTKISHVEDGSNAKYQLTGTDKTNQYFQFNGFDASQGGKNEVSVSGALTGAQDFVTNNYDKCNQSVNFVGRTYNSAENAAGQKVDGIGVVSGNNLAADITKGLAANGKAEPTVAAAQADAKNGNLVVGANGGHVVTMTTQTFTVTHFNGTGTLTITKTIEGQKTANVNGTPRPTNFGPGQKNSFQNPLYSNMIWYSLPAKK